MENENIENNVPVSEPASKDTEADKMLKRRFISGMLIGALCAMFVFFAGAIFFILTNGVHAGGQNENGVLNSETVKKVKMLENLVDTNYYKDDVDKSTEAE